MSNIEWPHVKTARMLVAENLIPCSEETLRKLAKTHGVGRKLGRNYVFTAEHIVDLLEKLPFPSNSSAALSRPIGTSAAPSAASTLTKALALATAGKRKTSSR